MPRNAADQQRIITQVTDYISSIPIMEAGDFTHAVEGLQAIMARQPVPTTLPDAIAAQLELLDEYLDPSLAYIEETDLEFVQPVLQQRITFFQNLTPADQTAYIEELKARRAKIEGQQEKLNDADLQPPAQGSEAHVESLEQTYRRLNAWLDGQETNDDNDDDDDDNEQAQQGNRASTEAGVHRALIDAILNGNHQIITETFHILNANAAHPLFHIVLNHQESILNMLQMPIENNFLSIINKNSFEKFSFTNHFLHNQDILSIAQSSFYKKMPMWNEDTLLSKALSLRTNGFDNSEEFYLETLNAFSSLSVEEQRHIIHSLQNSTSVGDLMQSVRQERKKDFFEIYWACRTIVENPRVFTQKQNNTTTESNEIQRNTLRMRF